MLLLLLITNSKKNSEKLPKGYEKGLNFWKEMFIPVVISMSASQNVFGAISGGFLAFVAGIASVLVAFLMLPLLNKFARKKDTKVMMLTPMVAKKIGLNSPRAAMIFGGLMGTTSGTTAGLAATDASLVPYGAMTSTFYTGLGCLLCPSVLYPLMRVFL